MSELERVLQRIKITKRRGEDRLCLEWEVGSDTIIELRNMGYLVLLTYERGYIDTIIGWGKE